MFNTQHIDIIIMKSIKEHIEDKTYQPPATNIKSEIHKGIYIAEFNNKDIMVTGSNGHTMILIDETIESVKNHIDEGNIKLIG